MLFTASWSVCCKWLRVGRHYHANRSGTPDTFFTNVFQEFLTIRIVMYSFPWWKWPFAMWLFVSFVFLWPSDRGNDRWRWPCSVYPNTRNWCITTVSVWCWRVCDMGLRWPKRIFHHPWNVSWCNSAFHFPGVIWYQRQGIKSGNVIFLMMFIFVTTKCRFVNYFIYRNVFLL